MERWKDQAYLYLLWGFHYGLPEYFSDAHFSDFFFHHFAVFIRVKSSLCINLKYKRKKCTNKNLLAFKRKSQIQQDLLVA